MSDWKPNATANDWQRWRNAGGMSGIKITKVVLEGVYEGKVIKLDATQQYLGMLEACSPNGELEVT